MSAEWSELDIASRIVVNEAIARSHKGRRAEIIGWMAVPNGKTTQRRPAWEKQRLNNRKPPSAAASSARAVCCAKLAREIDFVHDTAFSFDGARCNRIVAGVLERARNLHTNQA